MTQEQIITAIKEEEAIIFYYDVAEFVSGDTIISIWFNKHVTESKQRGGSYEGREFEEWNETNTVYTVTEVYVDGELVEVDNDLLSELINEKLNQF